MACFKDYVFLSLQVQTYNKTAISVAALHLGKEVAFFGFVPFPLGSFYNTTVNMKRKELAQYHRQ